MTGWRDFCIKLDDEVQAEIVALKLKGGEYSYSGMEDGYYLVHLPGYGSGEDLDEALLNILFNSSQPGYYVMANNTTDTGEGYIRLVEDGNIINEEALIKEGSVEVIQLGAPDYVSLYSYLSLQGFPIPEP